jgi:hypothetical protein
VLTVEQRIDRYCRAIFNFFGSQERWDYRGYRAVDEACLFCLAYW